MEGKANHELHWERTEPLFPHGKSGGLHVLVVDDDPNVADSMAMWLRCCGHRVRTASDGISALHAALGNPPDILLLDLGLPGLHGWDVARRLQGISWVKRPFIIALTGYDTDEDRLGSKEAGIDLHVAKPVDPQALEELLGRLYRVIMPTCA